MFVDMHTHILPGFDDGAADKEAALNMLRVATENQTGHIFATPHFIPGKSQIRPQGIVDGCKELQCLADENGLDLKIHPGCEVFVSPDLPKLYDAGLISTLGHSSFLLIELPMMSIPPYTELVLYKLQLQGLTPILAHPERNQEIIKRPGILKEMVGRGILIQINSGSLAGIHGREVKKFAMRMLKEGLVHFIASDAHSIGVRRPDLNKTAAFVEKECGREVMDLLFCENGLALLNNREVQTPEPKRKKGGIMQSMGKRLSALFNHASS